MPATPTRLLSEERLRELLRIHQSNHMAPPCEYGHFDCGCSKNPDAIDAPCLDEVWHALYSLVDDRGGDPDSDPDLY